MVTVTAELRKGTTATVQARQFSWLSDEALSAGGADLGPNPYETLLGSLAACIAITLRLYADHKKISLTGVDVKVAYERHRPNDGEGSGERGHGWIERIQSDVKIFGSFDDAQRVRLKQVAQRCPMHKTLVNTIEIVDSAVFE